MYAVFTHKCLLHLGRCQEEALSVFNDNPGTTLHQVENLEQLEKVFSVLNAVEVTAEEDPLEVLSEQLSDAANFVVQKLDELGVNAENAESLSKKLKDGGDKTFAEVKSLGIKGMQAVGEGFVALGDLLRKSGKKEECNDHKGCCGQ